MNLNIKQINKDNYNEVLKLQVFEEQVGFIETVEECLEEASENASWRPVGIYDEDTLVGFSMYGLLHEVEYRGPRVWLDRILIDKNYQGKGYGKASVETLLKRLYEEYHEPRTYLSVYDNNEVAVRLYKNVGFEFNGEIDTKGEKIMEINMEKLESCNEQR